MNYSHLFIYLKLKSIFQQYRNKTAFQLKADHPQAHFCTCDLDLDQ